jgi:mRNA interferase MazF
MMRGELWWADLGLPSGSEPGFRRPVVVIQDDSFNASRIATVLVAGITTNQRLSEAPGNVYLPMERSGLPKDSVINVTQLATLDKSRLETKAGALEKNLMAELDSGLTLVLGL